MALRHRSTEQWTQTDTATATSVSVLVSDTQVAAANQKRVELTVCNDHATQLVYLTLGGAAAVASKGIRLNAAGGSYTTTFTGEIRGISVGGTSVVTVSETTI